MYSETEISIVYVEKQPKKPNPKQSKQRKHDTKLLMNIEDMIRSYQESDCGLRRTVAFFM
jgi:hypothetical protein